MHSHDYLGDDPSLFAGKRVVVLGMGNSAMDIAVEAAQSAERVFLAARRGAWIVPKYVFGRPLDQYVTQPRIPLTVRQRLMQTTLRAAVGDMERYGLPKPDHRLLEAHPTVSDTILTRLTHGDITPKPNIARLTERTVVFADGSEEEVDVVVYGTGYRVSFPFFDPDARRRRPTTTCRCSGASFIPELPGLYFIALLQPLGATMPLAEAQSEWVCDHLTGRYALPPRGELRRRHRARARGHAQPLRRLQAPHDAGRLRRLPVRAQARAAARRAAGVSRREATKEANRAAILAAARAVFAEHGYEGAGVRDVVRRTDLAPGTFYNYFDGKDAVFARRAGGGGAEARRQVREARLAATTPRGLRRRRASARSSPSSPPIRRRSPSCERNAEAVLPAALEELREDLAGRLDGRRRRRLHRARDGRRRAADRRADADPRARGG